MPDFPPAANGIYEISSLGSSVTAAFCGRNYGKSDYPAFVRTLGLDPARLLLLKQVHGNRVIRVDERTLTEERQEGDGSLTQCRGIVLGVQTADCIPVLFSDSKTGTVAVAHAGWKGLRDGVLSEMIRQLYPDKKKDTGSLKVYLGPGIRKCCYQVGSEFQSCFPQTCDCIQDDCIMDIFEEAKLQMNAFGLDPGQVTDSGICTACKGSPFYSARRESTSERMLSVIALR